MDINLITEYEEMVKQLGKYEGQNRYVPYFWELFMDGDGGIDSNICSMDVKLEGRKLTTTATIRIVSEDRIAFPELKRRKIIKLLETDDGFIIEVRR